jgi:AbiV family abortive infection protein
LAAVVAFNNARDLHDEGTFLFEPERYARSAARVLISAEEVVKKAFLVKLRAPLRV